MSDRKCIEARIAELEGELAKVEGRPTEVYSRIVGYYRSVRNWNAGKRSEYAERRAFVMPAAMPESAAKSGIGAEAAVPPVEEAAPPVSAKDAGEGVLVFTRAACPNCPPVANYVVSAGLAATFVDVDRVEGLELAKRHGVMSTPTVLGLDDQGCELFRALDLAQLKARFDTARV